MTPDLTQATPDHGATQESRAPEEIPAPKQGASLRATEQIAEALRNVPQGAALDEYFGISNGRPKQSPEEAAQGEQLIAGLQAVSEGQGDFSALFGQITQHNESSGADPDALRALMGYRKKAE